MESKRLTGRSATRVVAEAATALIGTVLLLCAGFATQRWLDRHLLPSWFLPRPWLVAIESSVRVVLAAAGVWIVLWLRPRAGRLVASAPAVVVGSAIAAALAIGAGELVLRHVRFRPLGWLVPEEEPRRRRDPRLGWTFEPARTGQHAVGGHVIDYSFDAAGYRVRRPDEPVDATQPTIVFVGESVMFGEELTWEDSVPAQVGAMTGIQSANLAVHGFSSDQAYLRLERELPRFRRPVAVVSLFMTAIFGRNMDDNRPHLGPGLVWFPAEPYGRLVSLAKLLVPYRKDETIENGITMTRDVLRATVSLTSARGAQPLIVVPQFGVEGPAERTLRRRILDETGLPYVWIEIAEGWRLSSSIHPNARAAHAIASAIAARLSGIAAVPARSPAPRRQGKIRESGHGHQDPVSVRRGSRGGPVYIGERPFRADGRQTS